MTPPKLPGFGKIPRRRGRNERAVDDVARMLRDLDDYGAHRRAYVTLARTTGAALDRLEADSDRSEHVVGSVARVHAHALDALRPNGVLPGNDALDRLTSELAAVVRHPSP